MEKKKCKECGKEINSKAEICPNCGCRVKSNTLKILLICMLVIFSFIGISYGLKQVHNKAIEKKEIESQKQEEERKENIRNNLIGKYIIAKKDYDSFIESLKKKNQYISSNYDGESDFEFEITDHNISKYMGFDGVNFNDTIAYSENYVLIPLGILGVDRLTGNVAVFKISNKELLQVSSDQVDSILESFIIENYNLKCQKVN